MIKIFNFSIPKNWSIVDLPELLFFQEGPGVRNNQYTSSGIKLLNVANLQEGKITLDNTDRYISVEEAYGRYKHFLVDEGDLIIASSGIKVEYFEKKMGFVKKEHLPLCMNTSTIRFKSLDSSVLDIRYFMYFLKSNYFKKQIDRLITGSAQLNFGPSHLKQIKVILPNIMDQKRIVTLLDRSHELIEKRKAQIGALDQLTQNVFLEMFGDPVMNSRKWITNKMSEVAPIQQYKGYMDDTKIWLLNLDKVESKTGKVLEYVYVDRDSVGSSTTKFDEKNVLYSKLRPYLNKVVMPDKKGVATSELIPLKPNKEVLNRFFLTHLLRSDYFVSFISEKVVGAKMPRVSMNIFKNFELITPPLYLQNNFASRVEQIEEQKSLMQSSVAELENMHNALMQRVFKGELFKEKEVSNL